jgi:putative sugar O-methyltransferase
MVNEINSAAPIYRPSKFWEDLCATNMRMLREQGLENFKLSLAQNYYNWLVTSPRDPQFLRVLNLWLRHPSLLPLNTHIGEMDGLWTTLSEEIFKFKWRQRHIYRLYVGLLWHYMLSIDVTGLGEKLEEPTVGNPIPLRQGGKRISQDLANSIIEYNTIVNACARKESGFSSVAELGAGYGRLAHVFLSHGNTKRYCIFDIPPALQVSQWYLRKIFPERRMFTFRHFEKLEDVWDEFQASQVAFLTPNQLDLFPDGFFDLVLSISTFPEMRVEQINHFFKLFSRVSGGNIFIKQWINWYNAKDDNRITRDNYHLSPEWKTILDQIDPTMPSFFNKAWTRHIPSPRMG